MLLAVISMTATYSRITDAMAVSQLAAVVFGIEPAEVSPFQRDRVSKSLRRLRGDDVITYVPGTGRRAVAIIGLTETRVETDWVSDGNTGRSGRETQVDSTRKPSRTGGHSEKSSEKSSELKKLDAYACPLGLSCDSGRQWDEERALSVECECMKCQRTGARA
ncbi:MAG: hypothetical protein M3046_12535 [Actinomycetota bacterium]|nr:hypothetical protein [Actinomycetota bacterium]